MNSVNPRTLTLLERLALVGSTGRGALEFRPDHSVVTRQDYADFEKLALEAERILDSDDYMGEGIDEFQDRGGSPGGARPKIFVRYDNKEWPVLSVLIIVYFNQITSYVSWIRCFY